MNNDHHLDLIVANSGTNTIGIFLSNTNGTFQDQRIVSTGDQSRPSSIVVCRINDDQYFDIVVANYLNNNLGIFLGHGNGTFSNEIIVSLNSSHPVFVTFADLDNDNRTDLVVANDGTHSISILLGHGNGSFDHQQIYSTGYDSFPSSIGIADFNQDHCLDLAVTNSGTNNIGIFLGIGNGSFSNQTILSTNHRSNPSSLVIADINNDHYLDIIVANNGTGNIGIFLGHGNGTFQSQRVYSIDSHSHPQYINSGYFNKEDDILDLVIIDSINNRIYILLGYGNGTFSNVTTFDGEPESHPIWLNVVDLNQNNQSDLVIVNSGQNNILLLIDYFFQPAVRQTNYGPRGSGATVSVVISDFNNDSFLDIAFDTGTSIFVLTGFGNGDFNQKTMYSLGSDLYVQYICIGDLNSDGRTDIISTDYDNGYIDIFFGYDNNTFVRMKNYSTGTDSQPRWIALADFNHDDVLDIACANEGTRDFKILLGDGDGNFSTMMNFSSNGNPRIYSVAVGHFDDDNHLDLVVSEEWGWITIFLGVGNGSFILWTEYPINRNGGYLFSVAVAHFDSDSHLDIVVADTQNGNVAILLGYGDGTFTAPSTYSTGTDFGPFYVIVADFNNDNRSDIAASIQGSDVVVIFYGNGNGSFLLQKTFPTGHGSKPYGIAAADLDNDQQLELVVALWGTGKVAVLTEYIAAKFINQRSYSTGSALYSVSVAIGDFNNNNRSDLVVANSGTDNLQIFFTSNNGKFGTPMSYSLDENSHPQCVITCDVNEDDHPDIISVNSQIDSISVIMTYGNNTFAKQLIYSTGDNSHPSSIVAGYFNNDHRLDLAVTNTGTYQIGIFFGYNYASFDDQLTYSTIGDRIPYKMVVNDFNNDHYLDVAVLFPNNANFGILFGHGDGNFSDMITYPTEPDFNLLGIAAKDINNDMNIDIILSNAWLNGNIYVFLGYGNGSFAPMVTYALQNNSGPTDIVVDDFNNDQRLDIIVINYVASSIGVFLGHGDGTFSSVMTSFIRDKFFPRSIAVGYFNNDSYLDVAILSTQSSSVAILFGYGNGTFGDRLGLSFGSTLHPFWISVGDFNGDSHHDIATANSNSNTVGILLGYGNRTFGKTMRMHLTGTGSAPKCINVNDFNNDNILDIAVANSGNDEIVILFGVGDGTFLLGKSYPTGLRSTPLTLAIGDFNNDSRLDVAVANALSKNIGIFLRYDSEPFGSVFIARNDFRLQPRTLAAGDLDHDNQSDLVVVSYDSDNVGILLEFDGRTFNTVRNYSIGDGFRPYSIALAYLNNDTHLDIVVVNSESDNILFLFGRGNGTFDKGYTYSTGTRSRPYSVAINDLNNDHLMDIAIVNFGTSNVLLLYGNEDGTFGNETSYALGYGYHPSSIAAKDLNNDRLIDIAIACYDTNHVEVFMQMCLV